MAALVVAAALLFWVCVFMIYFASAGTTPVEFFLGRYEAPPPGLGVWATAGVEPESGLVREERWLLPEGRASASHLLLQVRFREPNAGSIVKVEEHRVPRRRVSTRSRR